MTMNYFCNVYLGAGWTIARYTRFPNGFFNTCNGIKKVCFPNFIIISFPLYKNIL